MRGGGAGDASQSNVRQRGDGPRQGEVRSPGQTPQSRPLSSGRVPGLGSARQGDGAGAGGVWSAQQGRNVGHSEGAGSQQAEEEGEASQDDTREYKVLRHLLLLPGRHQRVLCPHVPRALHRGPRSRNPYGGLRGEASGVQSHT